jgi:hypothetical protein
MAYSLAKNEDDHGSISHGDDARFVRSPKTDHEIIPAWGHYRRVDAP